MSRPMRPRRFQVRRGLRTAIAAIAFAVTAPVPAPALEALRVVEDVRAELHALRNALATHGTVAWTGVDEFEDGSFFPSSDAGSQVRSEAASGWRDELLNLRFVLTTISQFAGSGEQSALFRSQGTETPTAIILRAPNTGLADLAQRHPGVSAHPAKAGVYEASVPLLIWTTGGLHLGPGEVLLLRQDTGAFLINLGDLKVDRAQVRSSGPRNATDERFRPFLLTLGPGTFRAHGASFADLGFGNSPTFSGVSVVSHGIYAPRAPVEIDASRFEGVTALSLIATQNARVTRNVFRDAGQFGVSVINSDATLVLRNVVFAPGKYGIRVIRSARNVDVLTNLVLDSQEAAFMADNQVSHVKAAGNVFAESATVGALLLRSRCLDFSDNLVIGSVEKGVVIRASDAVFLRKNRIVSNRSAGIALIGQSADARTRLAKNTLAGNQSGLMGASPGQIELRGNDMRGQLPRLLDGDLTHLARALSGDLGGRQLLSLSSKGPDSAESITAACAGLGG